jgi:hypothetical protein
VLVLSKLSVTMDYICWHEQSYVPIGERDLGELSQISNNLFRCESMKRARYSRITQYQSLERYGVLSQSTSSKEAWEYS